MSTAELNKMKLELIRWISSLKDDKYLDLLNSVRISRTEGDWWDDLSDYEKNEIELGLNDLDDGKRISSEEFWKKFKNE